MAEEMVVVRSSECEGGVIDTVWCVMPAVCDCTGYSPKDLHGTNTAVFMGYHSSESESNLMRESSDGFGIMGLNAAMTANRVSYWLDLKGTRDKSSKTTSQRTEVALITTERRGALSDIKANEAALDFKRTLLENSWKFLISVGNLRRASKVEKNKIDWKSYYNNGVR